MHYSIYKSSYIKSKEGQNIAKLVDVIEKDYVCKTNDTGLTIAKFNNIT